MSQITYPESMTPLDKNDVGKSLGILQSYIGYICERTDFALHNMTKLVDAAGISTVEVYILLQTLRDSVAALEGRVTDAENDVTTLQTTVGDANSGLAKAVNDLQTTVGNLQTTVGDANSGLVKDVSDALTAIGQVVAAIGDTSTAGTILYQLDDLDRRVTALENQP